MADVHVGILDAPKVVIVDQDLVLGQFGQVNEWQYSQASIDHDDRALT